MLRSFVIQGALSTSAPLPFVALGADDAGVSHRVVFDRPTGPVFAGCLPGVAGPMAWVDTPLGRLAWAPFVEGQDLGVLLELGPLSRAQLAAVLCAACRALQGAELVGLGMRGDAAARLRVTPLGEVVVLADASSGAESLAAVLALWPEPVEAASLKDAERWFGALVGEPLVVRSELAALVASSEPMVLVPSALDGHIFGHGGTAKPGAAPKVLIARMAAFTLALGLAAGWLMRPEPRQVASSVSVRNAVHVEVDCATGDVVAGKTLVWLPAGAGDCTVHATWSDGATSSIPLRVTVARSYDCRRDEGAMRCGAQ